MPLIVCFQNLLTFFKNLGLRNVRLAFSIVIADKSIAVVREFSVLTFDFVHFLQRSPLTACQMLWINLIMDSLASFALSRDHPTDDILDFKPFGRKKPLIARTLLRNVIGHLIYQLLVMFILIFRGAELFDVKDGFTEDTICQPTQHSSIVFTTFVFMQLFNEINSRRVRNRNVFKGIICNYFFVVIWFICVVIQVQVTLYCASMFSIITVKPRLSGLIGTLVNSPDNRGSTVYSLPLCS